MKSNVQADLTIEQLNNIVRCDPSLNKTLNEIYCGVCVASDKKLILLNYMGKYSTYSYVYKECLECYSNQFELYEDNNYIKVLNEQEIFYLKCHAK